MKIIIVFVLALVVKCVMAQSDCPRYDSFMAKGQRFVADKDYKHALPEFQAAQIAARECKRAAYSATEGIKGVFDSIKAERDASKELAERIGKALDEAEEAVAKQKKAEKALAAIEAKYGDKGLVVIGYNDSTNTDSTIGIPNKLDSAKLKEYIKGEKFQWGDRKRVNVAFMAFDTELGWRIANKIFNKNPDKLRRYLRLLEYQGTQYRYFNTVTELEAYVSRTPGAISIIDKSPDIPGVKKIIIVDGFK